MHRGVYLLLPQRARGGLSMERLEKLLERQSGNHFANLTGIRVESADEMGVTLALDLHTGVTSHLGFAHAGALYTLAENAAGQED